MRGRLTFQDGILILGVLLLFGSIAGLYIDAAAAHLPEENSGQSGKVVAVVRPTTGITPADLTSNTVVGAPSETGNVFLVPADTNAPTLPPVNPTLPALPTALPTPRPQFFPDRIVIPAIGVDAPVRPAAYQLVELEGQVYQQWDAPTDYAAGWQFTSALPGSPGNTVLNGHHNVHGSVFGRLVDLAEGDTIEIFSGPTVLTYEVSNSMILAEEGQPLEVRLENARWLQTSTDERLTLVTCYPDWDNTHRLIIVARPIGRR